MAKVLRLFSGTSGLNTKVDPARLPYNPETGVQDLAVAYNVSIDDTGRVSRRKGFTQQVAGNFHSLFCDGGECLYVLGVTMGRLLPDYTGIAVATVTASAKMAYAQVNDRIYYCNGNETGFVEEGVNNAWVKGDYYGPETDRNFVDPPIGTDLGYYNGRIYVAQGSTCWYSEPFGFNLFDLTRNYWAVDSEIRMIRPVQGGVFVGSETKVYFFGGANPTEAQRITVCDYPVIKWSDCNFHGSFVLTQSGEAFIDYNSGSLSALWMSANGICYGGYNGDFRNLTEDKVVLPASNSGAGLVYNGTFIGLLNP
jgi:hypothetical protein